MTKFKPGDKVKRLVAFTQPKYTFNPDHVYVVSKVDRDGSIHLDGVPDIGYGYDAYRFELVKPRGPYLANDGTEINV